MPAPPLPSAPPDLAAYRAAVADLLVELGSCTTPRDAPKAEAIISDRITEPSLVAVLEQVPDGVDDAVTKLLREVRDYQPNSRSSAGDLAALIRIYLLSQIDAVWWGASPMFATDAQVTGSAELVDLGPLHQAGALRFRYRRQPAGLPGRARDWAQRRLRPNRAPHTAGLRLTRARPASVALLNQLGAAFDDASPAGTPPLWVTSLVRSLEHQQHLRDLGYSAMQPSAHCVGYAMDVELRWFRQFGADGALAQVLLDRQATGEVNVIDEGQAWHVCIAPSAAGPLADAFSAGRG